MTDIRAHNEYKSTADMRVHNGYKSMTDYNI